jgi:hypothetical protein
MSARVLLAGSDNGSGSPIGLLVVVLLCIAVYFLWKSLNKHIRRVPESFDPPLSPSDDAPPAAVTGNDVEERQDQQTPPGR